MFETVKSERIEELNCLFTELRHKSGARVIHLGNEDRENLFCLCLQTLPESSSGVAHILEHTVLCGSEKFPVRDPFFSMTRRSLNTYMNALTGSDFTCYPAASQVPKDFYNLLDVYIDAVFHPRLEELSFKQEGHRLELAPSGELEQRGIVFNEMKGAYTSPAARLHEALYSALFPTLTYGISSGGDPKEIPELTYEQLLEFHRRFYRPERCTFFFYGNIPLERHLDYLEKGILKEVQNGMPPRPLPKERRFKEPQKKETAYPVSKEEPIEGKSYIGFGWLTCGIMEQEKLLALMVLITYLMETDASPLKRALLRSGLCKVPSAYIDPDISEIPVVVTLKGCREEDADRIEALLKETLERIVKEGIAEEAIENVLHQLEFHRSEISSDHGPFGLSLFMRAALPAQHGAPAEEGLKIHAFFKALRKKLKSDPGYFTSLIQKELLDNAHFVRVVMRPDPELEEREFREERTKLQEKLKTLTDEERRRIAADAEELAAMQNRHHEDLSMLPKVTLHDVPKTGENFPLEAQQAGPLQLFHHDCFTNGILYADLVWDLPDLEEEELWLVRLFGHLWTQVGAGGKSYRETLERQQAHTGGLFLSLSMNPKADDPRVHAPTLHLKGKALYRKGDELLALMRDTAASPDLEDKERVAEILSRHFSNIESSLTSGAMKYAISLSASGLNIPCRINDYWFGLSYYHKLKQAMEEGPEALLLKLQAVREKLVGLEKPQLVLCCDEAVKRRCLEADFYGLANLPQKRYVRWSGKLPLPTVIPQGRVIASPVAFTGKALATVPYSHPDMPALAVIAHLLENLTLHRELREQGGAYGGGASCNSLSGKFLFYAYRDPNVFSSLRAFEKAVEKVANREFDSEDLEAAKLEKIQNLDSPVPPGSRADLAYSCLREGRSFEKRQKFRERLIALTEVEVAEACKKHLLPNMGKAASVVFAGRELLERENSKFIASGEGVLKIERV